MWSLGVIIIDGNFFEFSVCLSLSPCLSVSRSLSFLSFFSLVFDLDFFLFYQSGAFWMVGVCLADQPFIHQR